MHTVRRILGIAAFAGLTAYPCFVAWAQEETTEAQRLAAARRTINQSDDPLLKSFRWRGIGPIGQGGRVDDVAVSETDPRVFYVGFATGGIWKTVNNGVTFEPIFDTYPVSSVGDIGLAPSNHNIVYVGTGEPNNRQSSSFGDGLYKSTDGGRTFTHIGLRATQTIARVVVHPRNPDIVWVAANGHLFGPNPDRGVFKSTDGGRNWKKTLFVDDNTGATDLIIHPANPEVLFAATYQRRRFAWGFNGGGAGSGIWRSDNGGETWTRVTGNGLPNGTMGRVALDISRSNPNVIYAQIEVAPDKERAVAVRASEPAPGQGGRGGGGGGGGRGGEPQPPDGQVSGVWKSTNGGRSWQFLSNHNPRPMYFSQIRVDPTNENIVYTAGLPIFKSTDGGRTFNELDGFGHVDQHAIWINPKDGNHVIIGNDGSVDVSYDQGASWESLRTWAVGQPYHVSVDMRRPYFVCTGLQDNGSWCGPSSSARGAMLSQDWFRVGGGDGFQSIIDPTDHNIIYAESQQGNMSRVNLNTGESQSIRPQGPGGGRGGGGGGGRGGRSNIVPPPSAGGQLRFNWNTPIVMSPHNPSVLYTGANHFFKSYDRGDTWTMSADLSKQIDRNSLDYGGIKGDAPSCNRNTRGVPCILSKNDGVSNYGNILAISESPRVPGILWVGTDDGNVQVSRDGGATWTEVGKNVPGGTKNYAISRVEASRFDAGTAYISIDGHLYNDLKPYIYVTRDYGQSWTSLASDLPAWGNVNVVRQDPNNRNLLYAGTEFGFFVSLDEGRSWKKFMNNLATVRIDEVVVHPRDNDLVLATHGRSIQIMDDVSALQQLTPEVLAADAALFQPRNAILWKTDRRLSRAVPGNKNWDPENAPIGTFISYYLKSAPTGEVKLTITDPVSGRVFCDLAPTRELGINRVLWNLRGNAPPPDPAQGGGRGGRGGGGGGGGGCRAGGGGGGGRGGGGAPTAQPGIYKVTLTIGGREYTENVVVEEDRWLNQR
jgi:photosystem II stability/assembly factor-like uncharacterized protein